jgi:hypothetical protein
MLAFLKIGRVSSNKVILVKNYNVYSLHMMMSENGKIQKSVYHARHSVGDAYL